MTIRRKTKPGQPWMPGDHLPSHGYSAPTRTSPGHLPSDPRLLRKDAIANTRAQIKGLEKTYIRPQNEAEENIVRKQMKKDEEEYKKELQRLQKQKPRGTGLHPNNK